MTNEVRIRVVAEDKASKPLQDIGKIAAGVFGGAMITRAFDTFTDGLKSLGLGSVKLASDFNENLSKVRTVFRESSGEIEAFAKGAAADLGLSNRAALEAAGTFGNMFTQLRIATPAASDMSQQMTRLASDFASFHNADITQVIQAQTSAFRGEYDAVQRFVPTINAAAVAQKAMAMTGKENEKQLTAQDKALATYQLLLRGAGQAMGDFDRTSSGTANRMRTLTATVEDLKVAIGQRLEPVVNQVLGKILEIVQDPAFTQGVQKWIDKIMEFARDVWTGFNTFVIPAFSWIVKNQSVIIGAIAAIGVAFIVHLGPAYALAVALGLALKVAGDIAQNSTGLARLAEIDKQLGSRALSEPGFRDMPHSVMQREDLQRERDSIIASMNVGLHPTGSTVEDELKKFQEGLTNVIPPLVDVNSGLPPLEEGLGGASKATKDLLTLSEALEDSVLTMAEAAELHMSDAAAGVAEAAKFLEDEAYAAREGVFNLTKAIVGLQVTSVESESAFHKFVLRMVDGVKELTDAAASAIFGRPTREEATLQLQLAEVDRALLGIGISSGPLKAQQDQQIRHIESEISTRRAYIASLGSDSDKERERIEAEIDAREASIDSIKQSQAALTAPYERLREQLQQQAALMEADNRIQQLNLVLADNTLLSELNQYNMTQELIVQTSAVTSLYAVLRDRLGLSVIPAFDAAKDAANNLAFALNQAGVTGTGINFDQRVAASVRNTAQNGGFAGVLV